VSKKYEVIVSMVASPEINVWCQVTLRKVIILHGSIVKSHGCVQQRIGASSAGEHKNGPSEVAFKTHTLKTSSAVLRTMKERGSEVL
jgi:hypothetical protein